MRRKSVLVVEDDRATRTFLQIVLSDDPSVRVIEARDGEQAARLAKEMLPDLILLDVKLPRMSGVDVLFDLRAEPATRHIPVLVLTGAATGSDKKALATLGCTEFIEKPCHPMRLLEKVRQYLG